MNKLIEKNLLKKNLIESYRSESLLKSEYNSILEKLKQDKKLILVDEPINHEGYSAKDLEIFLNLDNWHPWQKKLYDRIFFKTGGIREPDRREIIAIYDEDGNSGKSSFFKYLCYKYTADIGRLTYGSSSQLKSAVVAMGHKKIYIIDLTRSKAKNDSETDLLSAIKDVKNGLVTTHMYGSGNTMLMDIPHVIVSSPYIFDQTLLSKDRWKILSIKSNDFIDITNKVKNMGKIYQHSSPY